MAIFRVFVRGQFADLAPDVRARLLAEVEQHHAIDNARFTAEGTMTYERNLAAFTFRYEMRSNADDAEADVLARATADATVRLDAAGITYRRLRASANDMAEVWKRSGGNLPPGR
jgi:hypothetical protein